MANRRRLSISLAQVETEIEELRKRLAEAEAVRSYLLRTAAQTGFLFQEGEARAEEPRVQANWAERINDVLAADPGRRFTIHQLNARLSERAPELASAADAPSLLRATLNRYARTFGWHKERQGRSMLWYREASVS